MKEIIVIETNMAGNGVLALRAAKARGYHGHFLTKNPDEYRAARLDPLQEADEVTVIDTVNPIRMLHFLADRDVAAVVPFDDFRLLPAAMVNLGLGLKDRDWFQGLINARFKERTRRITNGVMQPVNFHVVEAKNSGAVSPIGYPCVVKPCDESGSTHVAICHGDEAYRNACQAIAHHLIRPSGYALAGMALVEEYVEGDEYSAEFIWSASEQNWFLAGFTQKFVSPPPHRVEVGHMFPFSFGAAMDRQIATQLGACLKAIGLSSTAARVEFKLSNGRLALIEINPRLGGDMIVDLVEMATGRNLIDDYVSAYLNDAGSPLQAGAVETRTYAAIWFLTAGRDGEIVSLEKKRAEQNMAGLLSLRQAPFHIQGLRSSDDRLGFSIAVSDTPSDALRQAQSNLEGIEICFR